MTYIPNQCHHYVFCFLSFILHLNCENYLIAFNNQPNECFPISLTSFLFSILLFFLLSFRSKPNITFWTIWTYWMDGWMTDNNNNAISTLYINIDRVNSLCSFLDLLNRIFIRKIHSFNCE